MNQEVAVFVAYCYITNDHRQSHLRQHTGHCHQGGLSFFLPAGHPQGQCLTQHQKHQEDPGYHGHRGRQQLAQQCHQ